MRQPAYGRTGRGVLRRGVQRPVRQWFQTRHLPLRMFARTSQCFNGSCRCFCHSFQPCRPHPCIRRTPRCGRNCGPSTHPGCSHRIAAPHLASNLRPERKPNHLKALFFLFYSCHYAYSCPLPYSCCSPARGRWLPPPTFPIRPFPLLLPYFLPLQLTASARLAAGPKSAWVTK